MSNIGDLGRPIGGGGGPAGLTQEGGATGLTQGGSTGLTGGAAALTGTHQADPTEYRESGEHGQGVGVSGGHGVAHAGNSQSGGALGGNGFNGGLGSEHASAGIPKSGEHPIADKFMGQDDTVSGAYKGGSTGDALTGQSHAHTTGSGVGVLGENTRSSGLGAGAGAAGAGLAGGAIGGAYAGGSANDGLTGQSSAQTTGAGVGPLGENTHDSARAAALGDNAGSATSGAGVQSGVGPAGGAGGHYSADQSQSHSHSGAAAGAAGLGAGAAGAGLAGSHTGGQSDSPLAQDGLSKGHFGKVSDENSGRGMPISDPKDLDTGNPYSLVFQESTGKYVHRHELEEKK